MKKNRLSLAFLSLLIAASPLRAQDTLQNETVEQKDKRMEWFSQAKLGIFIHWGIYSVRGVSESWSFFNNYLPYDEYMEQEKYGAVYIACGPIYDTKRPKRIGNNKVAVPHAFYKVILINDKKNPQAIGFIFPNSAGHKPLKKYMVTVDSVEKRTDIDFFPALPDEIENRIEAELVQELP
jgi:hypothetical protein